MLKPYFTPPTKKNFDIKMDYMFRILMILFGTFVFAVGVNIFVVSFGLYNGGSLGIAMLVRTFLTEYLKLPLKFDVAGVIYFMINVPLFILAYRSMGLPFFIRTVTCVLGQSFFLSIVKVPAIPIVEDPLTGCLVGGIIAGFGSGCLLRAGGCSGGTDIFGIYMARKRQGYSVGKLNIAINAVIYFVCAIMTQNLNIVIYSVIYSTISAMIVDRVHLQNINMTAMIFTKEENLDQIIIDRLGRGVTTWEGMGAYTRENTHVIFTVVSKYEEARLKRIISECDEHAFVVFHEGLSISGNYEKRL